MAVPAGACRAFHHRKKIVPHTFSPINIDSLSPVINYYAGMAKDKASFLILARNIKVKERIFSDRQLADALRKNDLYRFVTGNIPPAHKTLNTLRKRLRIKNFEKIRELPKYRREGIILDKSYDSEDIRHDIYEPKTEILWNGH